MEDEDDGWCPSPRPMNDAAQSDGVEEWIASPQNEVAAEPAETVATQVVDAATPESSGSVAVKKRRFTQQVLQWETPPPKPVAPPPRAAPPPIRPLTDEEKKEKAYLKAQKSYTSDWLPKFDWLILDKTPEGDPCLRCSVCMEHGKDNAQYGRNGAGGRDLQIGSMRWHENSAKHEDAMNKLANLLQKIVDQKKIEDFANGDPEGCRVVVLMRAMRFVCRTDTPIHMYPQIVQLLAEEGVEVSQVTEEVDCVVSLIEHRYIDYDGGFGAGLSPNLSPFMARLKKGDKKVKVDGVDASGRPVKHTFELSELPGKKHKFGGTLAECVKLGKAFAREVVFNLEHRMRDLRRMGGMKLFRVDKWPANPDTRVRRCATWLCENSQLFNHQLPGMCI
ncbi:unnamed protein product [Closterium sp. Yama58-4]|nr:unnamed protein product [Closterium sp. Yama58-4]